MVAFYLIVAYLLLISATTIFAYTSRSRRNKWLAPALWSFLLPLVFSPRQWSFGTEGDGVLILPAPLALAACFVSMAFGREHLTFLRILQAAKVLLVPFVLTGVACFVLFSVGIAVTGRRTGR